MVRLLSAVALVVTCLSEPALALDLACDRETTPASQERCREQAGRINEDVERNNRAREDAWRRARAAADAKVEADRQKREEATNRQQEWVRTQEEAMAAARAKQKVEAAARAEAIARAEAADPFKRVDALDLQVSPQDFVGRSIKVSNLQCYAPSPSGRRCLDGEALVLIQPEEIRPDGVEALLDRDCASFRFAMNDSACRWTARFVLDDYQLETVQGERKVVLRPKTVELSQ